MRELAWHLPWKTIEDAPHALLDILRGCNISCTSCYNKSAEYVKTVEEVEKELKTLMKFRRLQSVSLIGGEVTLHPNLCKIVRMVKAQGLCVEIFTNGVLLEPSLLKALAEAGADLIFLHIDSDQKRPDMSQSPSAVELRDLINRKAILVSEHGIDVGLTMTAYEGRMEEVIQAIETVMKSPFLNYLLVTLYRDLSGIKKIQGDLHSGLRGKYKDPRKERTDNLTNTDIYALMNNRLQLRPFACIGSNIDENDPRWLSYSIGTIHKNQHLVATVNIRASLCERLFLALSYFMAGRYPMYQRQNGARFRLQLLVNSLTGGNVIANMAFLAKSCKRGLRVSSKRILFQCPAFIDEDGRVIHCKNCPDAVVLNGRLVPVCICDCVEPPGT